jgi:hypothetical protein
VTIVTPQFGQLGEPPFVPVADDGIAGLDRSWLVSYVATGAAHSVWVSDPDDQSRYSLDGPADQSAAARDAGLYLIWNALGHVPFDYIQTAGPAWVIGRSGDSEAGVYLGELRDAVQAGGEPTSTVRPGIVYRGSDLRLRVRDSGVRLVP